MAAGHSDTALLKEAGFNNRYDARLTFFKRTKALYDADVSGFFAPRSALSLTFMES